MALGCRLTIVGGDRGPLVPWLELFPLLTWVLDSAYFTKW
jgi:hypothetical protein